ncbi:MAG: cysteine hydrolase [Bryobacterales bacterium]|jgi:nicotinamidase/pyrazinamidase|nr:cysteine hydrolase [Bryobacterales bacterium]
MQQLFLDVDTQLDFLYPTGALCVPGATQILPHLAALRDHAQRQGIPVLSTCDAHLENDEEFSIYRAHCVAGTLGAGKAPETVLRECRRLALGQPLEASFSGQVVMEKRTTNMFAQPAIAEAIRVLAPQRVVVSGVVTEICVMHAVEGLLERGIPVTVVTDAVFALEESRSRDLLNHWRAAGCQLLRTADLVNHAP